MITLKLLEDLNINYFVVAKETTATEFEAAIKNFQSDLDAGKQVALVVRKNALSYEKNTLYTNNYGLSREEVIRRLIIFSEKDIVVSTTGKISRELFEIREMNGQGHKYDFLTVGSMGHSSSIALGIAMQQSDKRIWCIDGDGAFLMHMGAAAVIGACSPKNFIHVVINNQAHESVGGMPDAAKFTNLSLVAKACGYSYVATADSYEELEKHLRYIKNNRQLSFLEIKTSISSKNNLGRPTISPQDNKSNFMNYLTAAY